MSSNMMERLFNIIALVVGIQLILCPWIQAMYIRTVQKRSVDGLQEQENGEIETSRTKFEVEGIARPSQVNTFQFLLPFWWHYLRPMLNVFATNNNFRQSLQKEYEYEIEHGAVTEIETQEIEHSPNSEQAEGNEFEIGNHEIEFNERKQSNENEILDGENGRIDMEHMFESNSLTPFGTEQESFGQEQAELPEPDTIIENAKAGEEMGNSEEAGNISDFETNVNNFMTESETGDENQIEKNSDEENRRLFLTGNIIGSFSNSLREMVPNLWEQEVSEHDKHELTSEVPTNDEVDTNLSGWEQSSEGTLEMNGDNPNSVDTSFLLQPAANSMLTNSFGNISFQREDAGDRKPRSFEF